MQATNVTRLHPGSPTIQGLALPAAHATINSSQAAARVTLLEAVRMKHLSGANRGYDGGECEAGRGRRGCPRAEGRGVTRSPCPVESYSMCLLTREKGGPSLVLLTRPTAGQGDSTGLRVTWRPWRRGLRPQERSSGTSFCHPAT